MMVAAQVVGNDATIAWANALGSNFDLNVMMPVIAYNLLQSIDLLTNAAQHLAEKCVDAAKHPGGARRSRGSTGSRPTRSGAGILIERSLAMCTALAPRIGYDNAAAIAKTAYHEGRTIREVAHELEGLAAAAVEKKLGPPASASTLESMAGSRPGLTWTACLIQRVRPNGGAVRVVKSGLVQNCLGECMGLRRQSNTARSSEPRGR